MGGTPYPFILHLHAFAIDENGRIALARTQQSHSTFSLPGIQSIELEEDGSIVLSPFSWVNIPVVINEIITFFEKKSIDFLDTPNSTYTIPDTVRQKLRQWFLALC